MKRLFLILISCTLLTCSGCVTAESNDELERKLDRNEKKLNEYEQEITRRERQLQKDEAEYQARDDAAKASATATGFMGLISILLSWL